eukprot:6201203-Pleurochrysis_carterae.AAC.2
MLLGKAPVSAFCVLSLRRLLSASQMQAAQRLSRNWACVHIEAGLVCTSRLGLCTPTCTRAHALANALEWIKQQASHVRTPTCTCSPPLVGNACLSLEPIQTGVMGYAEGVVGCTRASARTHAHVRTCVLVHIHSTADRRVHIVAMCTSSARANYEQLHTLRTCMLATMHACTSACLHSCPDTEAHASSLAHASAAPLSLRSCVASAAR